MSVLGAKTGSRKETTVVAAVGDGGVVGRAEMVIKFSFR
jgi:hypothetical protein